MAFSYCCFKFGLINIFLSYYYWKSSRYSIETEVLQLHLIMKKIWLTFCSYSMQFKQVLQSIRKRLLFNFNFFFFLSLKGALSSALQHTVHGTVLISSMELSKLSILNAKNHGKIRMISSKLSLTSRQNWTAPKVFQRYWFNHDLYLQAF